MKAEGTREEFENLGKEISPWMEKGHPDTDIIIHNLLKLAEENNWITKPEWKQAYDDAVKSIDNYRNNNITFSNAIELSEISLNIMHNRIVELEKKLEKGE